MWNCNFTRHGLWVCFYLPISLLCEFLANSNGNCSVFAGGEKLHENRLQVPRSLWVVCPAYLLEENATVQGRGQPSERTLWWRCQGHPKQRRPKFHAGRPHHQAPWSWRPRVFRRLSWFLQTEPEDRLFGHARTTVQRNIPRSWRVRASVLWSRVRYSSDSRKD